MNNSLKAQHQPLYLVLWVLLLVQIAHALHTFSPQFSGTAKAGVGIAGMGQARPQLIMKSLIPVVMASIIGIYGLVVAVLISGSCTCQLCEYTF